MARNKWREILNITVVVSALGYFVDIYDLLLFSIVRVSSLKSLGVAEDRILESGVHLLNMQMTGMLLGGILWGILGDKRGRLSVLFGSIFLYSAANIANAFVQSVEAYGLMRLLAGLGLAGELGAAITLVSEILPKETRGYGTAIVAGVGILGAVAAALVGDHFDWRTAYIIGGVLGFILLALRVTMFESGMYKSLSQSKAKRGDLLMLFSSRIRFLKYLNCILIGLPIWFVIGILITFSPELSQALNIQSPILASRAVLFCYLGLSIGDLASGFLSQYLKSRRRILLWFLLLTFLFILIYIFVPGLSAEVFYALCFGLGVAVGYWAVFVTVASEQFGTNLRATVTTTVPNFVRGAVVPITLSFQYLKTELSLPTAALIVGTSTIFIALIALRNLDETYHKDLNYLEDE